MHFVDEHNRPLAVISGAFGLRHYVLDFLDAGKHGAIGHELRPSSLGDDSRESSLAAPGRAPEEHRTKVVAFDLDAQRLAGSQQVFLADEFIEGLRTHSVRKRTPAPRFFL